LKLEEKANLVYGFPYVSNNLNETKPEGFVKGLIT